MDRDTSYRISLIQIILLVTIAIIIDVFQFLLDLLGGIGIFLNRVIDIFTWLLFVIWFYFLGVSFAQNQKMLAASLISLTIEMFPLADALPFWTLDVILTIVLAYNEDKQRAAKPTQKKSRRLNQTKKLAGLNSNSKNIGQQVSSLASTKLTFSSMQQLNRRRNKQEEAQETSRENQEIAATGEFIGRRVGQDVKEAGRKLGDKANKAGKKFGQAADKTITQAGQAASGALSAVPYVGWALGGAVKAGSFVAAKTANVTSRVAGKTAELAARSTSEVAAKGAEKITAEAYKKTAKSVNKMEHELNKQDQQEPSPAVRPTGNSLDNNSVNLADKSAASQKLLSTANDNKPSFDPYREPIA